MVDGQCDACRRVAIPLFLANTRFLGDDQLSRLLGSRSVSRNRDYDELFLVVLRQQAGQASLEVARGIVRGEGEDRGNVARYALDLARRRLEYEGSEKLYGVLVHDYENV